MACAGASEGRKTAQPHFTTMPFVELQNSFGHPPGGVMAAPTCGPGEAPHLSPMTGCDDRFLVRGTFAILSAPSWIVSPPATRGFLRGNIAFAQGGLQPVFPALSAIIPQPCHPDRPFFLPRRSIFISRGDAAETIMCFPEAISAERDSPPRHRARLPRNHVYTTDRRHHQGDRCNPSGDVSCDPDLPCRYAADHTDSPGPFR